MNRNEAIKIVKSNWPNGRHQLTEALETLIPELKESEDERIRKVAIEFVKQNTSFSCCLGISKEQVLDWLEKQGEQPNKISIWKHWKDGIAGNGEGKLIYLIKDGDNYSLSSVLGRECDYVLLSDLDKLMLQEKQGHTDSIIEKAKTEKQRVIITETDGNANIDWDTRSLEDVRKLLECGLQYINTELEKQGSITKLSEEEQNKFAKGVLSSCALSFINYLDAHKYEGKMCVSNGECEDIENAFHNAMWDRLHRYYCKYIEKQGEQNSINKIQLGKKYKCTASPRYSTFMIGEIYKPEDTFLCNLMNLCYNCFEPIEEGEQKLIEVKDIDGVKYYEIENEPNHISEQKPTEWSEEDEKMLSSFLHKVEVCDLLSNKESVWILKKLKSLKPQPHWKPSDEQMEALNEIINTLVESKIPHENDYYLFNILNGLRTNLKKL